MESMNKNKVPTEVTVQLEGEKRAGMEALLVFTQYHTK